MLRDLLKFKKLLWRNETRTVDLQQLARREFSEPDAVFSADLTSEELVAFLWHKTISNHNPQGKRFLLTNQMKILMYGVAWIIDMPNWMAMQTKLMVVFIMVKKI